MDREFIFVVNGCTDDSEDILRRFVTESSVKAKVITSEKGIVPAFKEGVKRRDLNGFVGRFDADIFLHPHTLDLMQMHLVMNEKAIVTYAEPMAMDAPSIYNEPWYNPGVISKRLYFTGKTCLYRTSPYSYDAIRNMPQEFVADDIFPSFYFTYYYGLNSISRTPFAVVYEKVVSTFEDLVHQQSRCDSEIQRIIQRCQYLLNLNNVTVQEIYPGPYKNLMDRAKSKAVYVDDWIRVESTK